METLSVKECRRVKLPEAFELPRKFGVSRGCLTQKA
ncbi:paREP2a [Pyrobaculum aerophilum str. IM2]|uniref:PaREP2a n=1 Tax=Pyrobaculum aerophilum (strain ATCC 51768 / DSM 7523 / JCM 9630 / CIP 104966 / NBRC 100827 / IM2) TaxID=178306 RepID=Q8ZWX8_PYRAE|nr:paREP2a [Pyrobaculum aerophilum str. IM2]